MTAVTWLGLPVIVSDVLPMRPTPGQAARRIVRHGLADWLDWLGEDLGPAPDAELHALLVDNALHVSAAVFGRLRRRSDPDDGYLDNRPEPEPGDDNHDWGAEL
jgi:hypothetical protein